MTVTVTVTGYSFAGSSTRVFYERNRYEHILSSIYIYIYSRFRSFSFIERLRCNERTARDPSLRFFYGGTNETRLRTSYGRRVSIFHDNLRTYAYNVRAKIVNHRSKTDAPMFHLSRRVRTAVSRTYSIRYENIETRRVASRKTK